MKKIITWILNHKKIVLIFYIIVILLSLLGSLLVNTNYNLADYLPDEMGSKAAIDILKKEYGDNGNTNILIESETIQNTLEVKQHIQNIDGVKEVLWLDDVVDITMPLSFMDESLIDNFYKDGYAYMQVIFDENDYSEITGIAVDQIHTYIEEFGNTSGPATSARATVSSMGNNIKTAMYFVIATTIVILIVSTHSYFEVVLFLITIGIAILINNGTNIIFGEISFITASASSILQLAIAMDYSIFLLHRLAEERKKGLPLKEAMIAAVTGSLSIISASAVTTIFGFLALTFMSFEVGMDLGLVLAKGIFISLVTVITLLPVITMYSIKWIEKTTHRNFLPSFKSLATVFEKGRYVVIILMLIIAVPAFLGQQSNQYEYGSGSQVSDEVRETEEIINTTFGGKNAILILVDNSDPVKEKEMVTAFENIQYTSSVTGMYSYIDPATPIDFVPNSIVDQFISENFSRYIINLNTSTEGTIAFETYEMIKETADSFYDEVYITGSTPSNYDIMTVSESDYFIVSFVSILAVGLILLFTFRSAIIPIILLLVIEVSIWINMSVPYFADDRMVYLGFLIVSALQLGATIDYAILLTTRYLENRKLMNAENASIEAVDKAAHSIFTSSAILGACGLSLGFVVNQATIKSMGMLVGRGALISGFIVIFVLPQLLILCDPLITRLTYKFKPFKEERTSHEKIDNSIN